MFECVDGFRHTLSNKRWIVFTLKKNLELNFFTKVKKRRRNTVSSNCRKRRVWESKIFYIGTLREGSIYICTKRENGRDPETKTVVDSFE